MKNLNLLLIFLSVIFVQACEKYNPTLGEAPSAEDAIFSYAPSAANDNIIEFTANNPDLILAWDLGNGVTGKGPNIIGIYPNAGTYTITLTIFGRGGSASSTQEVVIAQTDITLLDNPLYNMLTGGQSGPGYKTWHVDSLVVAHFGVGPDPIGPAGDYPEYYAAGPNDKAGAGFYDDRYTFHLNDFKFDMVNNGEVYVHNSLSGDFPGSYQNLGDYTAPYSNKMGESWTLTEGTVNTLTISNDAFIGFYSGVNTYNIINLTDSSLWLQYQHHDGGLLWYLRLIPDGFVSGGGGGSNQATDLPIDFESIQPAATAFGNSTATVVSNPQPSGINTSANVMETIHGNETWAGLLFDLNNALDFSTNTTISLKVWAPATGVFRFKIENSSNPNDFVELDTNVTTANSWQTISVDFTGTPSGTYDRIVLFPGWNVANAGTFYLDDIQQQ